MRHSIGILISLFLLQHPPIFRDTTKNTVPKDHEYKVYQVEDPNELLLKFESFLSEEAREHRKHINDYTDEFIRLVRNIGGIILVIFTVLGISSWLQLKRTVNRLFQENVEREMEKKFATYDQIVKERANEYDALLLDLTRGIAWFGDQKAYSIDPAKLIGKKILWVDDHPLSNEIPEKVLTCAGINFTNSRSTEDALNILKKDKGYDLIITNMGRGKDSRAGINLLQKLNNMGNAISVIVFSRPQTLKRFETEILELGAKAVTGHTQIMIEVQIILGT